MKQAFLRSLSFHQWFPIFANKFFHFFYLSSFIKEKNNELSVSATWYFKWTLEAIRIFIAGTKFLWRGIFKNNRLFLNVFSRFWVLEHSSEIPSLIIRAEKHSSKISSVARQKSLRKNSWWETTWVFNNWWESYQSTPTQKWFKRLKWRYE